MWGRKEKKPTMTNKTIGQLISEFADQWGNEYVDTTVRIDNVEFSIVYNKFRHYTLDNHRREINIYLTDGIDKFHVYTQQDNKWEWIHEGSWCQTIHQIVQKQLDLNEERKETNRKKITDEENRMKEKFDKLLGDYANGHRANM